MNQRVSPPVRRVEPEGLTLTGAEPLHDIPALWRLAALVATLGMGALAVVGGLYLGRSILVPVVAGIIVGITLTPAVKLGTRYRVAPAISAVTVVLQREARPSRLLEALAA